MTKIALVAALEREVKPLVRRWQVNEREHDGWRYKFFESELAVLVCAGIGAEAARRATQAIISLYSPRVVWSVGYAGGLNSGMKAGNGFRPSRVVDASDGSSIETDGDGGVLVSYSSLASVAQKLKLARAYGAQAVDMEAAAVARGAQARGVAFGAYKVISDDSDFEIPAMDRFIREGKFRALAFVIYTAIRPWLWRRVIRLARNSSRAAETLCRWLVQYNAGAESLENKPAELHPMKRAKE
jgi:adenosylhomocysteine nucleosidase